ncbi:histidine kinase [Sphingomonas oleivorans]|uniref:histidine kinase n=1 Tax=Sphingomonas oleivorans TaxID=1735121 RepID=A0A2T5FY82_9SPHN|nr:sensor histidine kinase [Sphingomonas oleivorans]PTQ11491.1 histidine kinase [Sphingomonas oleivorans]
MNASSRPPVARISPSFARLSTGIKMLLILSTALLPLGLMALFASIQSASNNRLQHEADARIIATGSARQIDALIGRNASGLRAVVDADPRTMRDCQAWLTALRQSGRRDMRFALYDANGRRRCATPGYSVQSAQAPRGGIGTELLLLNDPPAIRFTVPATYGAAYGVGELPADLLRQAASTGTNSHGVSLTQGDTRIELERGGRDGPLDQQVTVQSLIAGGQAALSMTVNINSVSAIEVLLVLLPMLMWLAAAMIGWLVVDRLLLQPLGQLQRAVSDYRVEDGPMQLPRLTTPAHEIRDLAEAFRQAADELVGHEAELEEGLERQTKLTREVHHRVKNNLQVVASLINLHARGSKGDVASAYASIQRRVDALAVVHRNHYAEVEENRGVGLRALIGELAANLRATAPAEAAHMTITLNMTPAFASQDVAVPVAFLITEIVELVMSCDPQGTVAVSLLPGPEPDRALLAIEGLGLAISSCRAHPTMDRFRRIVEGLSRQLRSKLVYDGDIGRYEIEISIVPEHQER